MRSQDIPPHLHDRYGIRPRSPWFIPGLAAVTIAALAFGGWVGSRFLASRNPAFAMQTWTVIDDTHIDLQLEVAASDAPRWCGIRAQDFEHFDVGYVILPVAATEDTVRLTYRMHVLTRPTAIDILDCTPDPLTLAGAQFAPGVLPPAQEQPGRAPGLWG